MQDEVDINEYEEIDAITRTRDPKRRRITMRIDTAELELMKQAAEFYGKDVLTFMREAAVKAAALPRFKVLHADGQHSEARTS